MNLHELIDLHRAHYLDHFVSCIAADRADWTEVLLTMDRPAPDELYKLYRADALREINTDEGLQIVEIQHREPLPHAPWRKMKGESILEVRPFHWNRCIVEVLADRIDRAALIAWGTHWIDLEDLKQPDAERLKGVIHFLSPPSYPGGKLTFLVDFGTAPVKAVTELVQVLTIGSKSYHITLGADEPPF
jgi:hypothetical protein